MSAEDTYGTFAYFDKWGWFDRDEFLSLDSCKYCGSYVSQYRQDEHVAVHKGHA